MKKPKPYCYPGNSVTYQVYYVSYTNINVVNPTQKNTRERTKLLEELLWKGEFYFF